MRGTPPAPPPPPPLKNGNGYGNNFAPPPSSNGRGNGSDDYPRGEERGPASDPPVAEYIYRGADGWPHTRVVRTVAKQFPTYHWGAGDWIFGWPEKAVPYRLPELLSAAADAAVLICEGEKDCDAGARYGLITTCNPGGAGKWQPELTDSSKVNSEFASSRTTMTPAPSTQPRCVKRYATWCRRLAW